MHDISNVALLVHTAHMSNRINAIINDVDGSVHEALDPLKLLSIIKELGDKLNLVIIDFDLGIEEGFSILEKVKMKNPHVPVIVLTSNNKKEIFLKCIMAGAADFILKPFEDSLFMERIKGFLKAKNDESNESSQLISKSLEEYVDCEISKAKKGKYSFSVSMTTFFKPVDEVSLRQENEYIRLSGDLYNSLSKLFWVTDIYIQFGNQSFIGIFPFCEINNTDIINNKIINKSDEIKNSDVRLENYHIANAFVTYPIEGSSFDEVMKKLTSRMRQIITKIKSMDKPT